MCPICVVFGLLCCVLPFGAACSPFALYVHLCCKGPSEVRTEKEPILRPHCSSIVDPTWLSAGQGSQMSPYGTASGAPGTEVRHFSQQLTGIMCYTVWNVHGIVLDSSCFFLASQRHVALLRCSLLFYVGYVESMTYIAKKSPMRQTTPFALYVPMRIVCVSFLRCMSFFIGTPKRKAVSPSNSQSI